MIVLILLIVLFCLISLALYLRMYHRNQEEAKSWAKKQIALLQILMLLVFAVGFTQVQPFFGETRLINAILGGMCVAAAALLYWLFWTASGQLFRDRRRPPKVDNPPKR